MHTIIGFIKIFYKCVAVTRLLQYSFICFLGGEISMIILNTKTEAINSSLPFFICNKVFSLLSVYDCNTLLDYGSVIVIENRSEAESINPSTIEFTEKIICCKTVWWHLTVPKNNSVCEEIFLEERFMNASLLYECNENKSRTVYDDEL